ncbi:NAD(P)/FAD-dependent oxidoreductase [Chloroflexota bacterium]
MDKTADVVVIGGGIMCTSTAYHLAKRGVDVTLLEKNHLAAGSTAFTCGVIRQHYSIETIARMAYRALQVWENFDEVIGGDADFMRLGILWVAGSDHYEEYVDNIKMLKSIGIRADLLEKNTVKEMAPYLKTDDIQIGMFEPDGGVADGSMACNAFAARSRELGGKIRQGVEVLGIRLSGDKVLGVDTTGGPVDTPVVINTAGPWGPKLLKSIGVDIPAEPSRHQVVSFKQPDDFEKPLHPVVADFINGVYTRPDIGGLSNFGSLEDDTSDVVNNPDSYNAKADRSFLEEMVERSPRRFPDLNRGRYQSGWAGIYTVTPDWRPIIDKMDQIPGLVVGLGFSGSGFKIGPVVGEMLADLATGEKQCPIDSSIFRFGRFFDGEEIASDYEYNIVS